MMIKDQTDHLEPIAIIGIGCRFPGGASSPERLWELLGQKFDAIVDVPSDRWDARRFYDADPTQPGKMMVNRGGFLDQKLDQFDSHFFQFSPREADCVDPQQRLLLETSWEALEDAGIIPSTLKGTETGVFIGGFTTDWQNLQNSSFNLIHGDLYTVINSSQTVLSARLSYFYDLKGPCFTTDTACSSSLVSTHLACQSLRNKECNLAFVGGVNAMLMPSTTMGISKGRFLSPDGQCRSFDANAKGYVRGEGAGIIILKPLHLALQDRNQIYAVIRGSGVNHDGHTNGLALPNPEAQKTLIASVLQKAGVSPLDIQYVEAHGTGTPAGDPAEAWALDQVLHSDGPERKKCLMGSIKSNIGHLEAAAGVAGLIKAALCLKHRKVPANLHFDQPNPNIPFEKYCLEVPVHLRDFPQPDKTLFAGVNSFGYGGTNAHIVLQEFVSQQKTKQGRLVRPFAFPFSSQCKAALKEQMYNMAIYLQANPNCSPTDIAYTLCLHRERHQFQKSILAQTTFELQQRLFECCAQEQTPDVFAGEKLANPIKMAFVYTGMGPQWHGMGRELLQQEAVFRETMLQCDLILKDLGGWSLIEELNKPEESSNITLAQYAQPANFAIQAALTELLKTWGINPEAVVGHSIGEVGAAYASGCLTLKQALEISFHRSRLQSQRQGLGVMLAAELSEIEAIEILKPYSQQVFIAAINSPSSITLSGNEIHLKTIASQLDKQDIFHRFLSVNIAYHSGQMDGLELEALTTFEAIPSKLPRIPLYSTVTGQKCDGKLLDASYWWQNIRQPVLFYKTVQEMIAVGFNVFVEIGPHPVLGKSIKEAINISQCEGLSFYTLNKKEPEQEALARVLENLLRVGIIPKWDNLLPADCQLLPLPAYPWQRKKHWIATEEFNQYLHSRPEHVMMSRACIAPEDAWTVEVNEGFFPWLRDHQLDGSVVFPGAGYVEAGLALHRHRNGISGCILENVNFLQALVITPGVEPLLRISSREGSSTFQVHSLSSQLEGAWTLHASGSFHPLWKGYEPSKVSLEAVKAKCTYEFSSEMVYHHFSQHGMEYGPAFQLIKHLYKGQGEALASIEVPEDSGHYLLPPSVLDAALQTLLGAMSIMADDTGLALPVHIDALHFFSQPQGFIWCHAKERESTEDAFVGDLKLFDESGALCVELRGVRCRLFKSRKTNLKGEIDRLLYQMRWDEITQDLSPNVSSLSGQHWKLFTSDPAMHEPLKKLLTNLEASCGDEFSTVSSNNILFYCSSMSDSPDAKLVCDLLALVQLTDCHQKDSSCKLWILTTGVQHVLPGDIPTSLQESPLWGLTRVLRHEFPHLNSRIIDLDPSQELSESALLKILSTNNEHELAVRKGKLYGPKYNKCSHSDLDKHVKLLSLNGNWDAFELELSKPGSIENLRFRQTVRRNPVKGEIEIRVHSTSLNFKDLMKVMGLLDEKVLEGTYFGNSFGMECTGTVVSIGKGVKNFKVGDQVCAFAHNTFSSFLTLPAAATCAIPNNVSMEEASVLIPFITVLRGLKEVANLRKGEIILVHTATGGVGLAAIQYAQHVGAKIIGTAGNEEKRAYLKSLGIQHVADSRSLQFASQVMEWTSGRGVDIVLNALSGESLLKSWELMAPYGRFIEIGKRDITENTGLPMKTFQCNTLFAAIDLDRTFAEDTKIIRRLLRDTLSYFTKGIFKPLPCKIFPSAQVEEAFHFLARAKHIGKVMVKFENECVQALPMQSQKKLFHEEGSYLVTGGLSGFGLETAKWIFRNGGKHLILLSRHRGSTPDSQIAIRDLEALGARVTVAGVDVGNLDALNHVFQQFKINKPPLKGIFHAAMVLDDGFIADLNPHRLQAVIHPKMAGCWNLHQLSKPLELDYFVMYSSISSIIGNPGQGNYAAGNAFLDAFANYRVAQGLPALTVNWGAIADVGVVARQATLAAHLQSAGIHPFSSQQALQILEYLLTMPGGQYGIMDVDWALLFSTLPGLRQDSKFSTLNDTQAEAGHSDFTSDLLSMNLESQLQILVKFIGERVAHTLKMDVSKIDADAKLNTLGMDSLMAMELQHMMEQKLSFKIPTMELIKGPSIKELSRITQKLLLKS